MRKTFLYAIVLSSLTGCASAQWSTVSAVAVPSPVLLGPKVHVGGAAAPEPSVKHGIHVSESIYEKDKRSESWGNTTTTTTTTKWSSDLAFSHALARAMLTPAIVTAHENEPHAPTDVVRIGKIGLGYFERREMGSSYDRMSVELRDAYYFHHVMPAR